MAHWTSAQGQLKWVKNLKTCRLCDVTKTNPTHPNEITFLKIETRRLAESMDGLNSSVAIVAGES